MTDKYYQLASGYVLALESDSVFPPTEYALTEPNGLIAIGGELTVKRLLEAYRHGIFPWYSEGEPILWWSPDPRMVLFPNELKVSRSLSKVLNKSLFEIRINSAFREVITACSNTSRPEQSGTWLSPEMIEAYCQLHAQGYAMSVESWQNDVLVGGCYGVKINRMFYGESMFHHVSDASKVAFVHLVRHLIQQHVALIDCQMRTSLLASFGGREIPRAHFMQQLSALIQPSISKAAR
jgi:leucyl/phenylalanyl-tRNA--protein transferase